MPDILQWIEPYTLSNKQCYVQLAGTGAQKYITDANICTTSSNGGGACHGDSGGPLVDHTDPEKKTLIGGETFFSIHFCIFLQLQIFQNYRMNLLSFFSFHSESSVVSWGIPCAKGIVNYTI